MSFEIFCVKPKYNGKEVFKTQKTKPKVVDFNFFRNADKACLFWSAFCTQI